jgi:excisionase family DNA binding protein
LDQEPIAAQEHEHRALVATERLLGRLASADQRERPPKLVGPSGEEVELPEALFRVLEQAAHHLLRGDSVAIAPLHRELTTQQAADLLNVSRPYLVHLLEEGRIPFTRTGTHRRVRLSDLLIYKRDRDAQRQEGLRQMAALSQELGLYDE